MSDFSDRPFVAGSITGLRSFRVDQLGRLTGVSQRKVFLPGVNTAECHRRDDDMWASLVTSSRAFQSIYGIQSTGRKTRSYGAPSMWAYDEPTSPESKKPEHRTSGVDCECGFYAYFDGGDNPYHDRDDCVRAIIQGHGIVTIGSRGFRAEKAEILALVLGEKARRRIGDHLVDRVIHNYPDVLVYPTKREALDAHPVTAPEPLTPETCDDFWTRSAR